MAYVPKACGTMILIFLMPIIGSFAQEPPKATVMDAKTLKYYHADFQDFPYDFYFVGKQKYVLTAQYVNQSSLYYNFDPRPEDVFLSYYPGAGTEWFSEIAWLLVNNLNFTAVQSSPLADRVFWLEESIIAKQEVKQLPIESLPSPRIMQTNMPFSLIPRIGASAKKIIYFARNPKDTLVSFYNLFKSRTYYRFSGTIDRFGYYFQNDLVVFSPYWSTVKEGYDQKAKKNVLFLYSEEDSLSITKKMSKFLGKTYTDEQLKNLTDFMDNKAKIQKETWKGVFPTDMNENMNSWIKKNIGELKFPNVNLFS